MRGLQGIARAALLGMAVFGMAVLGATAPAVAFEAAAPSEPVWLSGTYSFRVNSSSFTNAGLSTSEVIAAAEEWEGVEHGALAASHAGFTSAQVVQDDINVIHFEDASWGNGSSTLGITFFSFFPDTSEMNEADIDLNGVHFQWESPVGASCSNRYDVRATVTHEVGHAIGLGHSSESTSTCDEGSADFDPVLCDATMYFAGGACDRSSITLECDDEAGIRYLYPVGGTRRADWEATSASSTPSPGTVVPGDGVTVTADALSLGGLSAGSMSAALYVETSPGVTTSGNRVSTSSVDAAQACRSREVVLQHQWRSQDAGVRWLVVRLDDGGAVSEHDEANNLVSVGPFTVTGSPVLSLSESSLTFSGESGGASPSPQVVFVQNDGGGTFDWTASDDRTWISLAPTSGVPGESFAVTVDPSGLPIGTHQGTVTVEAAGADGSPALLPVTLNVGDAPVLSVSPGSLSFVADVGGPAPPAQQLAVTNDGGGTLSWGVSDDAPWLTASPSSGTDDGSVSVSADPTGLPEGVHEATITVEAPGADGSPVLVPVTLSVGDAPLLEVTPTSLAFSGPVGGPAPASQDLVVTNGGGGVLDFSASDDGAWLTLAPSSGTAPETIVVSVDPTGLPQGTVTATITIAAPDAGGSPRLVPVSYTLSEQPSLTHQPSSLTFAGEQGGPSPSSQTLTVGNDGGGTMDYEILDDAAWLAVSPASGTLGGGASLGHAVNVDSSGLAAGEHLATITILSDDANDSPQEVPVTLTLSSAPPLVVSPSSLAFEATASQQQPPSQDLSVSTSGESDASWSVTTSQSWISAAPLSGVGDGTLAVSVDGSGLPTGTHQGTVTITAPTLAQSPASVVVELSVADGPRLAVSSASLSFAADMGGPVPPGRSVSVSNAGSGTLDWSVSGQPFWLSVAPSAGAAPSSFTAQPSTTDLAPGRYTATLTVTAVDAYDSPRAIQVTYDVQGPSIVLTPARLTLQHAPGSPLPTGTATVDAAEGGGFTWSAETNRSWLHVSPTTGSAGTAITVSLARAMPPGVHDAAVLVEAPGAENAPAPLPVTVVVREPPAPSAYPATIELATRAGRGPRTAATIAIDEAGGAEQAWSVLSRPDWLALAPPSGAPGTSADLIVDAELLAAGTREGTLVIASGGSRISLPASLQVSDGPVLSAEPSRVGLLGRAGGTTPSVVVTLVDESEDGTAYAIETSEPWLRVSPSAGTTPATLSVSADATALAEGRVSAALLVRAEGETLQVPVSLDIEPSSVPLARFDASTMSGCAPLSVSFQDRTDGAVSSRTWSFGDGATSSAVSPTHVFDAPGTHLVTLETTGTGGRTSFSREIVVRGPPLAHAGRDRIVAFATDAPTRVALADARAASAAPARVASIVWTSDRGTFEDTGTARSTLERPVLVLAEGRGGIDARVDLTVTDDAGCESSDQAIVSVLPDFDADADFVVEVRDDCPGLSNPSQSDADGDGWGDSCDGCPFVFDPLRLDLDGDRQQDACNERASLILTGLRARECDEAGFSRVRPSGPAAPLRRLSFDLDAASMPVVARATGRAAVLGGSAHVGVGGDPRRVELRVPVGLELPLDESVLEAGVAMLAGQDAIPVAASDVALSYAAGTLPGSGDTAEVLVEAFPDLAPADSPDGRISIGDVVRVLRASVGLDELDPDEAARADVAPGMAEDDVWHPSPDCRVTIQDVVIVLRLSVGDLTL